MVISRAFRHALVLAAVSLATLGGAAHSQGTKPTQDLNLTTGRALMPAVTLGDQIYVLGGYSASGVLSDSERIDAAKSTDEELPAPLVPRICHTAQADGKDIYIIGGQAGDAEKLTEVVERYDPIAGISTQMAPLPTPRRLAASALVDGKIYVIGGGVVDHGPGASPDGYRRVATVEVYDIAGNRWTAGPPLPSARECAVAVKDGIIYAVGGYDGKASLKTFEALDPATGTWRKLPDLPVALSAHHMVVDGDKLFTFGDFAVEDLVTCYDFTTHTWQTLKTPFQPRRHAAVALVNHTAYVIGGNKVTQGPYYDTVQAIPLAPYEH